MRHHLGVAKDVIRIDDDGTLTEVETVGALWLAPADGELVVGDVVIYTLGAERLRGALEAAAAGEPVDAIMLSIDAAALEGPDSDEDE